MNKSKGSKLFKLKTWLQLSEATKYLSIVFGEDVIEADILRWTLDGRLKLSVYFQSTVYAVKGSLMKNTGILELLPENEPINDTLLKLNELLCKSSSKYIFEENESGNIFPIKNDIFNLPMVGSEWDDIQLKWKDLIGGPNETYHTLEETLVEDSDGNIYALKEFFSEEDHFITPPILTDKEFIVEFEKEWFEKTQPQRNYNNYYPAILLPPDSVLVVRTEALREFELLIADDDEVEKNPVTFTKTQQPNNQDINDRSNLSNKLQLLITASELFWKNADLKDRTKHATNDEVSEWLVEKGLTKRLGDTGATIIRPEGAGTGRKSQ